MIALLRLLKVQGYIAKMCGRGLRIAPDKENCLILDFGMNISRHGPIDNIAVDQKLIKR